MKRNIRGDKKINTKSNKSNSRGDKKATPGVIKSNTRSDLNHNKCTALCLPALSQSYFSHISNIFCWTPHIFHNLHSFTIWDGGLVSWGMGTCWHIVHLCTIKIKLISHHVSLLLSTMSKVCDLLHQHPLTFPSPPLQFFSSVSLRLRRTFPGVFMATPLTPPSHKLSLQ